MTTTPAIQIVHFIPGRVRLKCPRLKGNTVLASQIHQTLLALHGIWDVAASPTTGSVLIRYDPAMVDASTMATWDLETLGSLMALAEALGLSMDTLDMDELQRWLHIAQHGMPPDIEPTLSYGVQTALGSMNNGVTQLTGGLTDLRLFIPLTLGLLGVRSLLVTEQLPFPGWYDYLWFAFGTYMALHVPRPVRQ